MSNSNEQKAIGNEVHLAQFSEFTLKKKITLLTNPHSRGNTVYWMLKECEAEFDCVLLHFNSDTKSEKFQALNPLGKVPVLIYEGQVITESGAMCAFLADIFPNKFLKPAHNDKKLADYYRWLFFVTCTLDSALISKVSGLLPTGKAAGMSSVGEWHSLVKVLNDAIDNASPYLCGEQFTVADILMTSYLLFAIHKLNILEMTPAIDNYLSPIMARSAFQEMMHFAEEQGANYKPYHLA